MARVLPIIRAALIFLCIATVSPALAQQTPPTVTVRASAQGGYARVVFDWPAGLEGYTAAEEKGRGVIVTFNGAGRFDWSAAGPLASSVYEGLEVRADAPPAVFLKTGSLTRLRHFRAGNRIIVDLYGSARTPAVPSPPPPAARAAAALPQNPQESQNSQEPTAPARLQPSAGDMPAARDGKQPEPPAAASAAALPQGAAPPQKSFTHTLEPAPSLPAARALSVAVERLPEPALAPHSISYTTTESVGMAVFERGGTLWLVFDRADIQPAPRIAGPQQDRFPAFERVPLTGGTAFRMALPSPANIYAEGGGLVWRVIVTPVVREALPVAAVRQTRPDGRGMLFWPMTRARQVLAVKDPSAGDTLRVVTVSRAGDFSGAPQSYVEADSLDTPLGLALAPKVDDLEVAVAEGKGITLSRPKGLSLADRGQPESSATQAQATPESAPPALPPPPAQEAVAQAPAPHTSSAPPAEEKPAEKQPSPETAEEPHTASGLSGGAIFYGPPAPPSPPVSATPSAAEQGAAALPPDAARQIFDFRDWTMGGQQALRENKRLIMAAIAAKDDAGKVEDLLALAKMHVANGWGAEALGYLRIVSQILPELESNPRFIALRGAAQALSGKYESAIRDLLSPDLDSYQDVNLWRAYTLAQLEDWQQATARMPASFTMLDAYPAFLRADMALALAEIALRDGKIARSDALLAYAARAPETLRPGQKAALDYFRAESLRQRGNKQQAAAAFETLAKGKDDQFRARAGLAVTNLLLESKSIDAKEAVDRLERLRFSWRGDEFEPILNYRIGALYLQRGEYAKGLSILRDTVEEAPGNGLAETITSEMMRAFRDVFLTDTLKTLSPLDAITLYEEFRELVPPGDQGNLIVERLAEVLAGAELYGRAGDLLQYQIDHSLKGAEAARAAVRLAAIRLLDGRPESAVTVIDRATAYLDGMEESARREKIHEMALLRARAFSKMDKPEQALGILNAMPPDDAVNRLRVDIAWSAGNWDEAAQAMQDIILDQDIPPQGPLKPDQATLLLNRAVALNLADNRVGLANMRERFASAMGATDKGKLFDVVTRPRQNSVLADRETLTSVVSEVDMFKNFLETVREGK